MLKQHTKSPGDLQLAYLYAPFSLAEGSLVLTGGDGEPGWAVDSAGGSKGRTDKMMQRNRLMSMKILR